MQTTFYRDTSNPSARLHTPLHHADSSGHDLKHLWVRSCLQDRGRRQRLSSSSNKIEDQFATTSATVQWASCSLRQIL